MTDQDLKAIRERWPNPPADMGALLGEVERLRAAMRHVVNELGWVPELARPCVGNTNVACLEAAIKNCRQALGDKDGGGCRTMSNQMKVPITMRWRPIAEWTSGLGCCVFAWSPYADDTGQLVWCYTYRLSDVPGPGAASYFVELVPPITYMDEAGV